jgi:hypothetical protein
LSAFQHFSISARQFVSFIRPEAPLRPGNACRTAEVLTSREAGVL